jgi:hypothetical protein
MLRVAYPVRLLFPLLLVMGCAGRMPTEPPSDRLRRDILTREQIVEMRSPNLLEALTALRSTWLLPRGSGEVLVYLNDTRLGGVETLRWIPPHQVRYIQYFDGIAASGRWGLDHGQGVIYLSALPPR